MYKYRYKNNAFDFMKLSLYYTYSNYIGVCNFVFTAAMFILTATMWQKSGVLLRCIMVLACCMFTVIQPLSIYGKARKSVAKIEYDTEISFENAGIKVMIDHKSQMILWGDVTTIVRRPTMVVIYTDKNHGYILPDRVLGTQKKEFIRFIHSCVGEKSKLEPTDK